MAKLGLNSRLNSVTRKSQIDTTGYKPVMLDPETLVPSEANFYSQDNIEELADNMRMVGNVQPILVGRVNGQDRVISGHRRRQAILLNKERGVSGFDKIECLVKEMSENMFMLTLLSANMFNRKLSDWEIVEQAKQFKEYLKRAKQEEGIVIEGKMRDYIADAMGVSNTKMAQIDKINSSLCEEGKEALKNGEINFTMAYETSKLDPEQQKQVIGNKHLLSKDVKELVEQQKAQEEQENYTIPGQTTIEDYIGSEDKKKCIYVMGAECNIKNCKEVAESMGHECKGNCCCTCDEECEARCRHSVEERAKSFEPQPDKVESICYDCIHWNECDQKESTVKKCNEYVSKKETQKTAEQRYSEQQNKIDKQTKEILQQQEYEQKVEEKLNHQPEEREMHVLRETSIKWNDYLSGDLTFIPVKFKENENWMKGDRVELQKYAAGVDLGRRIYAEVTYVMSNSYAFKEDYFVVGIRLLAEEGKQ